MKAAFRGRAVEAHQRLSDMLEDFCGPNDIVVISQNESTEMTPAGLRPALTLTIVIEAVDGGDGDVKA